MITPFGPDATFSSAQMNDPRLNQLPDTVDSTGANTACMSAEGIYDLHGNLNEWTSDVAGTFRGGSYVEASLNGSGCLYRTTAHDVSHHDFSTGFRCCTGYEGPPSAVPAMRPSMRVLLVIGLAGSVASIWWRRLKGLTAPPTA